MARLNRFLIFIGVAVVAIIGGYFAHVVLSENPRQDPAQVLLAATLEDLQGHEQPLSQWRGKVMVVNFWATWCPPCVKEIPAFVRLQHRYADKGVQFVGIAIDDKAKVASFVARFSVNYPTLLAQAQGLTLARAAGNHMGGLPFTVVIDRRGRAAHVELGALEEKKLESIFARILQ